jgi:hypothetical protein
MSSFFGLVPLFGRRIKLLSAIHTVSSREYSVAQRPCSEREGAARQVAGLLVMQNTRARVTKKKKRTAAIADRR